MLIWVFSLVSIQMDTRFILVFNSIDKCSCMSFVSGCGSESFSLHRCLHWLFYLLLGKLVLWDSSRCSCAPCTFLYVFIRRCSVALYVDVWVDILVARFRHLGPKYTFADDAVKK